MGSGSSGPTARDLGEVRLLNRMQGLDIGAGGGNSRILDMQYTNIAAYTGVRVMYRNYSSSQAMTVQGAVVAGAANPTVDGNTLTWSNVLFSGASSIVVPLGSGAGSDFIPGFVISDEVSLNSVARNDGGSKVILRVRTAYSDNSNICSVPSTSWNSTNIATGYQFIRELSTNPLANIKTYSGTPFDAGGSLSPDAVFFRMAQPYYSQESYGDSLTQSTGSVDTSAGWPQQTQFLAATDAARITTANYAVIGQTHTATYDTLTARLAAGTLPTIMTMFGHSINSGSNQAAFDASWVRVQAAYASCVSAGVTFGACYNPPSSGVSDTLIQQQNTRLSTLPLAIKFDFYTALQLGGVLNPLYDNGDGVHINPAGQLVMAGVVKTAYQGAGIW